MRRSHGSRLRRCAQVVSGVALSFGIAACSGSDDDAAADAGEQQPADAGENGSDAAAPPEDHEIAVEVVTEELAQPWGIAFLPDGDALVTQRGGQLVRVDLETGNRTEVSGIPSVATTGQGGLLDVALHPNFEEERWVYLTYSQPSGGNAATAVGRARLEGDALTDFEALFAATPHVGGGQHFGTRIAFDEDGYLFVSTGDRGARDQAQNTSNAHGAVVRLHDDGEIPDDNPFVDDGDFEPAIYSFGHRNVQGMAIEPATGRLWLHEHGQSGGDEMNLIRAGENYGWPLAAYGLEYDNGNPIGDNPSERTDLEHPIYWWDGGDSYAPSGMAFYDGEVFPGWQGDLFVGSLVKRHLARFRVNGETLELGEILLEDRGERVRDVRVGPDGYLYVLIDASSAPLLRLVPADE